MGIHDSPLQIRTRNFRRAAKPKYQERWLRRRRQLTLLQAPRLLDLQNSQIELPDQRRANRPVNPHASPTLEECNGVGGLLIEHTARRSGVDAQGIEFDLNVGYLRPGRGNRHRTRLARDPAGR